MFLFQTSLSQYVGHQNRPQNHRRILILQCSWVIPTSNTLLKIIHCISALFFRNKYNYVLVTRNLQSHYSSVSTSRLDDRLRHKTIPTTIRAIRARHPRMIPTMAPADNGAGPFCAFWSANPDSDCAAD